MNFNSLNFLIYFPLVSLLFFLLPHKFRWIWLLIASYYFYMSWNPSLVFLILFTTVVSYFCALQMEKTEDKKHRKIYMLIAVISSLGVLGFFKYFNFLSTSVTDLINLFGLNMEDFTLNLLLPVGISFYTFQTLSYVVDVYNERIPAEHHFGYYALFVSFFPQLVAGPIERPEDLIPQLKTEQHLTNENLIQGLKQMLCGFFKKVVVADTLATYVNYVYNENPNAPAPAIILATILFTFQVYCDFSGYTDIAIGCGRILGIRLTQNFKLPFTARSITEFWTLWHISLTSWFRDYVYYPLATNRKISTWARKISKKIGKKKFAMLFPPCFALMVTFFLSGLWHGAAWTFVLWGSIHGVYQIIEKIIDSDRKKLHKKLNISEDNFWLALAQRSLTFILCVFALIFFRANTMSDLGILLHNLFTNWSFIGLLSYLSMDEVSLILCIFCILIIGLLDRLFMLDWPTVNVKGGLLSKVCICAFLLMSIVCAWMILLAGDGTASFIYFQF